MTVVLEKEDKLILGGLALALVGAVGLVLAVPASLMEKFPSIYEELKKKYKIPDVKIINPDAPLFDMKKVGIELDKSISEESVDYFIDFYDNRFLPSVILVSFDPEHPNTVKLFDTDFGISSRGGAEEFAKYIVSKVGEPSFKDIHPHPELGTYDLHIQYKDLDEKKLREILELFFEFMKWQL